MPFESLQIRSSVRRILLRSTAQTPHVLQSSPCSPGRTSHPILVSAYSALLFSGTHHVLWRFTCFECLHSLAWMVDKGRFYRSNIFYTWHWHQHTTGIVKCLLNKWIYCMFPYMSTTQQHNKWIQEALQKCRNSHCWAFSCADPC